MTAACTSRLHTDGGFAPARIAIRVACAIVFGATITAHAATVRTPRVPLAPRRAETVTYVTHPGDTLFSVAERYLRDPSDWHPLARINHVAEPRHLQPGLALRLPVALLRQERPGATVIATSGPASHAFRNGPPQPLSVGGHLAEGDRVRTGHEGFATLELPDGSHLLIPPDSAIDIGRLRRTVLTGTVDRVIDLNRGGVESEVTHATKKDDRFQIRSPSVVAGVRGTRFRVNYNGDSGATAVEVIEGAVGVDAASRVPAAGVPLTAATQLVPAHYGSLTLRGGAIGAPVSLLGAPELKNPSKIQDDEAVAFDVVPIEGAQRYRVRIARDAGLLDTIRDVRVDGPHLPVGTLDDGTYFVSVTAISADGLEGMPGTYAFERRRMTIGASAGPEGGGRSYLFRWFVGRDADKTHFRLIVSTDPDLRAPLVDRTDISGGEARVSNLPGGVYYWTVIAEQFDKGRYYAKAGPVQSFRLAR